MVHTTSQLSDSDFENPGIRTGYYRSITCTMHFKQNKGRSWVIWPNLENNEVYTCHS